MFASTFIAALLLLASATTAQNSPTVLTFVSPRLPDRTSEGAFTIQTFDPSPTSENVVSIITDPALSSVTGVASIPAGEIPLSTGSLSSPTTSKTPTSSATRSAPAQQSSGPASPALRSNGYIVVLAGAGYALF